MNAWVSTSYHPNPAPNPIPAPNPSPTPSPNSNPNPNPNPSTRYGPLRLPMLLSGWAEAARLGWEEVPSRCISPVPALYLPCISAISLAARRGWEEERGRCSGDMGEI